MPRRSTISKPRKGRYGKVELNRLYIQLIIVSVVAVLLAIFALYASFTYASLTKAFMSLQNSYYYLSNSYGALQSSYLTLQDAIHSPSILRPAMRFYVGTSPANVTGLTKVGANQVFCPENATIVNYANSQFAYPYYTLLSPGATFNFTFVYNASSLQSVQVVVPRPFLLASFNASHLSAPKCGGYPNGLFQVSMNIRAPASNYTGPITVLIYHS